MILVHLGYHEVGGDQAYAGVVALGVKVGALVSIRAIKPNNVVRDKITERILF